MRIEENYLQTDNNIKTYLNEIGAFPMLTIEEEKALREKIKKGDKKAKETLFLHNMLLVVPVAKKYAKSSNRTFLDICQDGMLGLKEAVNKFDVNKNCRFSTYATICIYHTIQREKENTDEMIKKPAYYISFLKKVKKVEDELTKSLQRYPSIKEIALEMKVKERIIAEAYNSFYSEISLNAPIDDEEDDYISFIADETAINPETKVIHKLEAETLNSIMEETLTENEKFVLEHRFGLNNNIPTTQQKIADYLNVTQTRVAQLEKRALKKLKERLIKKPYVKQSEPKKYYL